MQKNTAGVFVGGAAFAVGAVFLFSVSGLIATLGQNIPQENIALDYAYGALWAALLGLSILLWPVHPSQRRLMALGWFAKCVVTLGFMLVYEYYFITDSFGYWWSSTRPWWIWDGLHAGNGTVNIGQFTYLHAKILPDSFHLMKVSFSMLGFLGICFCYRAIIAFLGREDSRIFYGLALYPSILFWSSTLGKDPVMLLGVGLYVYGVARWYATGKMRFLAFSLVGIWIAMLIRIWMGPIMLAPMAVFVFSRVRGLASRTVLAGAVIMAFLFSAGRFGEQFRIDSAQDLVATIDANAHNSGWEGGSGNAIQTTFTSPLQVLAFLPYGAFTALFRPLPGEVMNPFGMLAGIEDMFLLWLLWLAIKRTRLAELKEPRLIWSIGFILAWASSYGIISAQNLGAAVRFRLQILPVLLAVLLYLSRRRPQPGGALPRAILPEVVARA